MRRRRLTVLFAALVAVCALAVIPLVGVPSETGSPAPAGPIANAPTNPEGAASIADSASSDDAAAEAADDPAAYEPGCALAMLEEGASADDAAAAVAAIPALAGIAVTDADGEMVKFALPEGVTVNEAVSLMEEADGIAAAQPNFRYYLQDGQQASASAAALSAADSSALTPQVAANDPRRSSQWALASLKAPAAWNTVASLGKSNATVGVAVLDSGFLATHEDLEGVIARTYNATTGGADVHNNASNATHGTHVAGIIAAQANNGRGVSGVAYNTASFKTCKLVLIQVANGRGEIYTDTLCKAYKWMKGNRMAYNIRVANMSLGGARGDAKTSSDTLLGYSINGLWNDGVVTVAAAGNINDGRSNTPFRVWPSDLPNVVSVINLAQSSNADGVARSGSSNFNVSGQVSKDVSAPGTSILSTYSESNDDYASLTGTSMASPAVAGVLALEFKANPKLTPAEATSKLFSTTRDLTKCSGATTGWDRTTGYGEVNAFAAVSTTAPYLSGATMMTAGKKSQLAVKVNNAKQNASAWTWTSSNTAVATVSSTGLVTGKKAGEVIITAKKGGKVARQTLTISGTKTNVANLAISIATQTYTGGTLKPDPVVRDGSVRLTRGKHYTVTWSNNKNVGFATATVKGISPYSGTTTKTFAIRPKGTALGKPAAEAGGFAVSWSKQATQTTGYQLQIATDSAFTQNKKTFTKSDVNATGATVSNLNAKTTYYLRIRTYKKISGKTLYSTWSATKSVKTK